jgi:hypothetical protein
MAWPPFRPPTFTLFGSAALAEAAAAQPRPELIDRLGRLMAKPTLITDFKKDGSFTIGAAETSQSEREIRNGWREPKWTTM